VQFRSPTVGVPRGLLVLALALSAAGCETETDEILSDDSSSDAALLFRLSDFLGDVPCSSAPGAMRSYVATLVDRTASDICGDGACVPPETLESCPRDCAEDAPCGDGACDAQAADPETAETCPVDCGGTLPAPFTLPSSVPVSCSQGVRFDDVAGGHRYSVQIDGYEAFAGELGPAGWSDPDTRFAALRSGSRHMVDAAGLPVTPRWLGACGEGEQARTVVLSTGTSVVLECDPPVDTGAPAQTAVVVEPQSALGSLACFDPQEPGEPAVASFDIFPQNGLPNALGITCGNVPVSQTYTGDKLVPGQAVDFYVAARAEKGGDVTWGSTCSAVVKAGLTVTAACAPLSDRGSILVDMAAVLATKDFACGGDFSTFDLELTGPGTTVAESGVPCEKPPPIGPLLAGEYSLLLNVRVDGGLSLFSAECTASVEPGRAVTADCTAL
jgi:hypothetical protein